MKNHFSLKNPEQWDSGTAAWKLILGFFIVVGTFSTVVYGGKQLVFLLSDTNKNSKVINLPLTAGQTIPSGLVTITGFASEQYNYDSVDPLMFSGFHYTTYYLYALLPNQNSQKNSGPMIVVKRKVTTGNTVVTPPENVPQNKPVTITGVIGRHAGDVPDYVKKWFQDNYGDNGNSIYILDEGASRPTFSSLLVWFTPFLLVFSFGTFLVIRWIYILRKQMFSPISDSANK